MSFKAGYYLYFVRLVKHLNDFFLGLYHRDSIFIAPAINALGGILKYF